MSGRRTEKADPPWRVLQAFAAKAFPEAATKAARAAFPLHANLDEKIKEKFGRGVRNLAEESPGRASKSMK